MGIFWEAVLWGLGVSIGSCGGLIGLMVIVCIRDAIYGKPKMTREIMDMNRQHGESLETRNSLTRHQTRVIERVAVAIEAQARVEGE
jgi:hypothetical protein